MNSACEWVNLFGRDGTYYTKWDGGNQIEAGEIYFWNYWDAKEGRYRPKTLVATAYDKNGNIGLVDVHTGERIIVEDNHCIEVQKSVERFK